MDYACIKPRPIDHLTGWLRRARDRWGWRLAGLLCGLHLMNVRGKAVVLVHPSGPEDLERVRLLASKRLRDLGAVLVVVVPDLASLTRAANAIPDEVLTEWGLARITPSGAH